AKNYLTTGGAQKLREELSRLIADRPQLAASAASDDIDAKYRLQVLDQRLRHLQESLRTAEVVTAMTGPMDIVRFGATVTVRERDGSEARYRSVGVDETDIDHNQVSWLSPLARALLNARRGDRVAFKAPRGPRELEVVAIENEG